VEKLEQGILYGRTIYARMQIDRGTARGLPAAKSAHLSVGSSIHQPPAPFGFATQLRLPAHLIDQPTHDVNPLAPAQARNGPHLGFGSHLVSLTGNIETLRAIQTLGSVVVVAIVQARTLENRLERYNFQTTTTSNLRRFASAMSRFSSGRESFEPLTPLSTYSSASFQPLASVSVRRAYFYRFVLRPCFCNAFSLRPSAMSRSFHRQSLRPSPNSIP
jgi:hypothetical protein